MLKIQLTDARVHVRVSWRTRGSVLKDTVKVDCTGVVMDVEISSDESVERITRLLKTAREGCYAESILATPIASKTTLTLNGARVDADTAPTFGQTAST